jgi:hypothetical protein
MNRHDDEAMSVVEGLYEAVVSLRSACECLENWCSLQSIRICITGLAKQHVLLRPEVTKARSEGCRDQSVASLRQHCSRSTGGSSTVTPYANDSHGESNETDSSSCLFKNLGGLDSLLDSFAIDVFLVLRGQRLGRNEIGSGSKTSDERRPEHVWMSSTGWRESVGEVEGEDRDDGKRAQVQRGRLFQRDQDMVGGLGRGESEQRGYGQSGQRVRGSLIHVS